MTRDEFRTVVKALITNRGQVLLGQKKDGDMPHSGVWHFLGGHVDKGEQLDDAIKREVKEETGLDVEVHQIIDAMTFRWGDADEKDSIMVLYHCEADSMDVTPRDDLQDVKWVYPSELKEEIWNKEVERIETRERWSKFIEKLKKMPDTV